MERLWPGGPLYQHEPGLFPLSSDTAWLGEFLRLGRVGRALDLGCGGGALSLQMLGRKPGLQVTALDVLPRAAERTRQNGLLNGWTIRALCGDIRDYRALLPREGFDLVASNPPYFPASARAAAGNRDGARRESCGPEQLCAAAAWLLPCGGRFALCYPPARLSELLCCLTAAGLEPKRLRLVYPSAEHAPCTALVESCKQGGRGLEIAPPLLVKR